MPPEDAKEQEDVGMADVEDRVSPAVSAQSETGDQEMEDGVAPVKPVTVARRSKTPKGVSTLPQRSPSTTIKTPSRSIQRQGKDERLDRAEAQEVEGSKTPSTKVLQSVEGNDFEGSPTSPIKIRDDTKGSQDPATANFDKDLAELREILSRVDHKAAQVVLRENWRTFLFDPPDEGHIAFILRAGLKNATAGVINRVVKDDNVFRGAFVDAMSQRPVFRRTVIESATPEEILAAMPREILYAIIAGIIRQAKPDLLVYWLAKGQRLGFEEDDIRIADSEIYSPNVQIPPIQPTPPTPLPMSQEAYQQMQTSLDHPPPYPATLQGHPTPPTHHLPLPAPHTILPPPTTARSPLPPPHNTQAPPSQGPPGPSPNFSERPRPPPSVQVDHGSDALLAEQNRQRNLANRRGHSPPTGPLVCSDCHHQFANVAGYQYHLNKKPCLKVPPPDGYKAICANCRQGFTTKQGNDYHQLKRVCLADGDEFPTSTTAPPPGYMAVPGRALPNSDGVPRPSQLSAGAGPSSRASDTILPPRPAYAPRPNQGSMQSSTAHSPAKPAVELSNAGPSVSRGNSAPGAAFSHYTPPSVTKKQAPRNSDDVRIDPSQLPPERLAAMNRELDEADRRYEQGLADIPADWDEERKEQRRQSLKNANASRKSQIRKSYGVTLRMREKDKVHRDHLRLSMGNASSSPTGSARGSPVPSSSTLGKPMFDRFKSSNLGAPQSGQAGQHIESNSGFTRILPPNTNGISGRRGHPSTTATSSSVSTPYTGFGILKAQKSNTDLKYSTKNGYPQVLSANSNSYQSGSAATSGSSTPSTISNPSLKRRHEEIEHERRVGSGQGPFTGPVPSSSTSGPPTDSYPTYTPNRSPRTADQRRPGIAMIEVASQDAAAKFRKAEKVQVHVSGAQVKDKGPGKGKADKVSGGGAGREIINIDDSDSNTDVDSIPAS